mmetsp:Transcript_19018/g.44371  ORF Transcript_19018/g.44371 Transcript_19018/m.44371 type:complete len:247 (-) Transcript_19018:154-894(-)
MYIEEPLSGGLHRLADSQPPSQPMCRYSNCTLIGHISLLSVILALSGIAIIGVWYTSTAKEDRYCYPEFRVTMWGMRAEEHCSGSSTSDPWEEICDGWDEDDVAENDSQGCAMWRPSLTLHLISFILSIAALSTAGAQACGCCCPGTRSNLHASMGLSASGFINLFIAFVMFSTAKDQLIPSHSTFINPEFDYAYGWVAGLVATLLYVVTLGLIVLAAFFQELPGKDPGPGAVAPAVTVVGQPVDY